MRIILISTIMEISAGSHADARWHAGGRGVVVFLMHCPVIISTPKSETGAPVAVCDVLNISIANSNQHRQHRLYIVGTSLMATGLFH